MLSFSNLKELHYNLFSVSFLIYAEYYVDRRNFQFFSGSISSNCSFFEKSIFTFSGNCGELFAGINREGAT